MLTVTRKPIIVSHSNCKAVTNNERNLSDDQIRNLTQNGGVMGIVFADNFLTADPSKEPPSVKHVMAHIDHAVRVGGVDHVGIGSDFDGFEKAPVGLEDSSKLPNITDALLQRGYSEEEVMKILGRNFLRVLEETLRP